MESFIWKVLREKMDGMLEISCTHAKVMGCSPVRAAFWNVNTPEEFAEAERLAKHAAA